MHYVINFLIKISKGDKMKKIIFLALAILAICITVSAVSADEGWSFSFGLKPIPMEDP
jgi:hypothetical protein